MCRLGRQRSRMDLIEQHSQLKPIHELGKCGAGVDLLNGRAVILSFVFCDGFIPL